MGQNYGQLRPEERSLIYRLHADGIFLREIARQLNRNVSTISRELRRNASCAEDDPAGEAPSYEPIRAAELAASRRWRGCRLERDSAFQRDVVSCLAMGWSPEIIAGRLSREQRSKPISHESIYRYIYSREGRKQNLHRLLRQRKTRRGRRARSDQNTSKIKGLVPIAQRPDAINTRQAFGHWEGDCMAFSKTGQQLIILAERQTRALIATRLPDKTANRTAKIIRSLMQPLNANARASITFDRGTEFAHHHTLNLKTFFCDPHSPWQKGTVENAIGRLRSDLPRNTNLDTCTPRDIQDIIQNYNDTPRKCLDFQTPYEAFALKLKTVALGM